jgi:hypothetical protein
VVTLQPAQVSSGQLKVGLEHPPPSQVKRVIPPWTPPKSRAASTRSVSLWSVSFFAFNAFLILNLLGFLLVLA